MTKKRIKTPGIYLEKNGTYYLKFRNKTYRGFETPEDAEIHRSALKLGRANQASALFSTISKDYLISEEARVKTEEVTYGTYDKRKSAVEHYIDKYIGDTKMNSLSPNKLREFRLTIANLELSSPHKNYILATTKQILMFAIKYHNFPDDLTIYLDYFPATKTEKDKKKNRLKHIWNDTEFELFLSHVENDLYRLVFVLFFKHGLRIGEAQALKWTNYDSDNMTLNIEASITKKTKSKGTERKDTKTPDSERLIYVGKSTSSLLDDLKIDRKSIHGFTEDWYIFGTSEPLSNRKIDGRRVDACESAELDIITNHEMRHMFVTNAWSSVPLPALSRYIGHKNVAVTLDKYSHLSQEDEKTMNKYFK